MRLEGRRAEDSEQPFFCFDCGVELFPEDVEQQVRDNGVFFGKCVPCLDENGLA